MGKINVLSAQVANLIAAGEVVDRPASVVKELIENAIDAHASHITVEIQNGGVSYIRVSDDGNGIAPEDMPLALKRHATSKIAKAEDLAAIFTLGFRGEALAAISSVSKLRILSKTADAPTGTMLISDGGEITSVTEAGCPTGTTVTVEALFANVPARRKFLKKDSTEASAVCANVEKVALSHPEIAFRLISDGNVKLESAGDGKLENAVYSILGRDFAKRILPVKCHSEGVDVYGYIGCPDNVKPTRNFQNFFINHRFVKSRTVMAALEQAYDSYIAPERFPCCVLFIDIAPTAVDVNVHPAKLEVRFSDEKRIFETVYYAVRSALEKNVERPYLTLKSPETAMPYTDVSHAFVPVVDRADRAAASPVQGKFNLSGAVSFPAKQTPPAAVTAPVEKPTAPPTDPPRFVPVLPTEPEKTTLPERTEKPEVPEYRILGVAYNTYIFVECGEKVVVIDKHAAHERILFEGMRGKIKGYMPAPQMLLVPITVGLSQSDFETVRTFADEFHGIGFDFETEEASRQVRITQIPSALKISEVEDVFSTMADRLSAGTGNIEVTKQEAYEKALYQASCKAAMKGGRMDSEADVRYVVEKILTVPDITVCPHGRPVVIYLTKKELDRMFGRE